MTHPTAPAADPVALAAALIRCPSVTPAEGGALGFLAATLEAAGFTVERPVFQAPGTPDIENLYARIGSGAPHLTFAGHTDVVPPGDPARWRHDPFAGTVEAGELIGRGAVDMKGGIACFLAAALDHLAAHGGQPRGTLSFLITGDEEGPSINGTVKLLAWAAARGERFDHCLLGEPTNPDKLGDMIKIGRRGSLSGTLVAKGVQGHAAYPHLADNPIRSLHTAMEALMAPLDAGTAHFQATNLEFVSVDVGNPAFNVIPAEARARFNVRFNDSFTGDTLKAELEQRAAAATGGKVSIAFEPTVSDVFLTAPGAFVELVSDAVEQATGRRPVLSTSGGTSDARFIKDYCPVVEFGLVGRTMHQIDERVAVDDLVALTAIYRRVLDRYFAAA
jgi:succinyl-diaminopimelate desuccinylase